MGGEGAQAHSEAAPSARFYLVGSYGSNQARDYHTRLDTARTSLHLGAHLEGRVYYIIYTIYMYVHARRLVRQRSGNTERGLGGLSLAQ